MKFVKGDLVELFVQLGYITAQKWSERKMRERAEAVAESPIPPHKLTEDTKRTLFALQATHGAKLHGWSDGITVHAPPKRKKKRRTKLNAYPYLKVTRRQGKYLHDYLKKNGFVHPDTRWERLSRKQKEEAVEWAIVELTEAWLDAEDNA